MRLASLVLLVCLALPLPALAFRGRVVDDQGRPVAGATVSVLGRTGEAITDQDGRFEWKPDPQTVVPTVGVHASAMAVIAAMTAPGDRIAFEQLTYSSISRSAKAALRLGACLFSASSAINSANIWCFQNSRSSSDTFSIGLTAWSR